MSNYTEADVESSASAIESWLCDELDRKGPRQVAEHRRKSLQVLKSAALEGAKVPGLVADNAVLHSLVRRAIYGKGAGSCTGCGRKGGCAADCEMAREAAKHRPGAALLEEASALQARVAELESLRRSDEELLEGVRELLKAAESEHDALRAQVDLLNTMLEGRKVLEANRALYAPPAETTPQVASAFTPEQVAGLKVLGVPVEPAETTPAPERADLGTDLDPGDECSRCEAPRYAHHPHGSARDCEGFCKRIFE